MYRPFYRERLRSINSPPSVFSISLDSTVNPTHKGIGSQETNGSSQESVDSACQTRVCEEQQRRHEAMDVQVVEVVINTICEDPYAARGTDHETVPPPVIVLLSRLASETTLEMVQKLTSENS
jgi:hypothetical protein